jgi:hypothetical protein
VFAAVGKAIDRAAEALASEGVELDSGRVVATTRMRRFRAPGLYVGGGIRRTPARLVLTKQKLHIVMRPQRYGILERSTLDKFTVGILDGKLHLQSSDPPGATGSVDYRVKLADPEKWVAALTAAGAKPAAA